MIVITHDLAILYQIADTILVMYAGKLAEKAPAETIVDAPRHPYTRLLISSLPEVGVRFDETRLAGIPGKPPSLLDAAGRLPVPRPLPARVREVRGGAAVRRGRAGARGRVLEGGGLMLALDGVSKVYKVGTFGAKRLRAVNDVSFQVAPGEVVSLIGESGSGKSTIGRMVLGLSCGDEGDRSRSTGSDVSRLAKERRAYYADVQGVFQDPFSSYNPIFKADRVFTLVKGFFPGIGRAEWDEKVDASLDDVRLEPGACLGKYPHQLSGGQLQRMLIARALLLDIKLLVADEIISMLDASTRIDVLNLLGDLKARGLGVLFITHDLSLGNYISRPHGDPSAGRDRRGRRDREGLREPAPSVHADASRVGAAAPHEVVDGHAPSARRADERRRRVSPRRGRAGPPRRRRRRRRGGGVTTTRAAEQRADDVAAEIPWEDRPAGTSDVVWRSSRNPIVTREHVPGANSIFNSAVVPYEDGYAGVFRVDDTRRLMNIHAGRSRDGVAWTIDPAPISFTPADPRVAELGERFEHAYDPRVTWLEDRYYVTWCNGYHGPTIGIAHTTDFATFAQLDNAFLPFNRNGVLFPRRIGGAYAMLSRPSDGGHTPFGEVFYSESPDLVHWGRHRHVMAPVPLSWQATKIGAGPTPIETSEGWLVLYHGVLTSCNGFVYSMGAALLDLDEPWRVVARGTRYLLAPRELYEQVGDVPNVVFPCAALVDAPADRVTIYYGGADTVVCMAHAHLSELLEFTRT